MGVRPRDAWIPPDWPLDPSGRLACTTCHEECGAAPAGASAGRHRLRGGLEGHAFCRECHGGEGESPLVAALLGGTALGGGTAREAAAREAPAAPWPRGSRRPARRHAAYFAVAHPAAAEVTGGLDAASRACLYCHDGAVAPAGEFTLTSAPGVSALTSHPIGVPYPAILEKRTADGGYVPRGHLDPRIVLPGGQLGCISCHSIYSPEKHLLALSNRESRLCYACHDV